MKSVKQIKRKIKALEREPINWENKERFTIATALKWVLEMKP